METETVIKTVRMHSCGNSFLVIDDLLRKIYSGSLGLDSSLEIERAYRDFWREYRQSPSSSNFQPDGLLFALPASSDMNSPFRMKYFDVDRASGDAVPCNMCGNGIRSLFRYIYDNYRSEKMLTIVTDDGPKIVSVYEDSSDDAIDDTINNNSGCEKSFLVQVNMGPPRNFCKLAEEIYFVDTSIGHLVCFPRFGGQNNDFDQNNAQHLDWARTEGRRLRFDNTILSRLSGCDGKYDRYEVNFVTLNDQQRIEVVTYEAGVEDLTMACGTGATASAYVAAVIKNLKFPITVKNPGGKLIVNFNDGNLYMIGPAEYLP